MGGKAGQSRGHGVAFPRAGVRSWDGCHPWDVAPAPAQPQGSLAGCSPSSPHCPGGCCLGCPKEGAACPGEQFSVSCSWAGEKQAEETSGFSVPFPTGCRTAVPSCPPSLTPCWARLPGPSASAPQHPGTLAPFSPLCPKPGCATWQGKDPRCGPRASLLPLHPPAALPNLPRCGLSPSPAPLHPARH